MQKSYSFTLNKFDLRGINIETGESYFTMKEKWELDFYSSFSPFYANYMFSNYKAMRIIDRAMGFSKNLRCGFELINGVIDFQTEYRLDRKSRIKTVYAIGSNIEGRMDHPVHLIIDPDMRDGEIILKYISRDEGDNGRRISVPVNPVKEKVKS